MTMVNMPLKVFFLLVVIANWAINVWFILILLRLVLSKISRPEATRWCAFLKPLTDPAYTAIQRWLVRHCKGPPPTSAGWVVLLAALFAAQQVLLELASAVY
jgi:hypothetical protein